MPRIWLLLLFEKNNWSRRIKFEAGGREATARSLSSRFDPILCWIGGGSKIWLVVVTEGFDDETGEQLSINCCDSSSMLLLILLLGLSLFFSFVAFSFPVETFLLFFKYVVWFSEWLSRLEVNSGLLSRLWTYLLIYYIF